MIRLALALLTAAGLAGCASLGAPDDPDKPIPPARPSPFSDAGNNAPGQF